MPLIWAAISAHGFGHAAQVVPVLNALKQLVPHLRVVLRTTVPEPFFRNRLTVPWVMNAVQQDIGCLQNGPLTIDVDETWRAHHRFHLTWDDRVQAEVDAIQTARPDVILADTPYLAVAAGKKSAVPTVALVSFTWDLILSNYHPPLDIAAQPLIQSIRRAYAQADLALRITPAPRMTVFDHQTDIGPICEPVSPARERLATELRLASKERTVLIGFGGIPLTSLPFEALDPLPGYRFLFDGPTPPNDTRFVSTTSLPFSFRELLASVDIVMTKPGYGIVLEAVALRTPLVYVRRYHFADEQPLVEYLHRHGRGVELSQDDFIKGRWRDALDTAAALPMPPGSPPKATGATDAADLLAPLLQPA